MDEFRSVAGSYPTVVLSLLLIVSVVFLLATVALGGGDSDVDAGADGDGLNTFLAFVRLDGAPLSVTLTLWSVGAWLACYAASAVLDPVVPGGPIGVVVSTAVLAGAVVVGLLPAALAARPLAHGMRLLTDEGRSQIELAGRLCQISTGRVTDDFGQAEVTLDGGATVVVQVRGTDPSLTYGSTGILLAYDDRLEAFAVVPAPDELGALPTPPTSS
jgi:hypothetical protein